MKYLKEFLGLRCSGDVINATAPVQKMAKEITEATAIFKRLRKWALKEPGKYTVVDLCAGNALAGILAIHMLPLKHSYAVDIVPRRRDGFSGVKRWEYLQRDIYEPGPLDFVLPEETILVSSHACGKLSQRVIDLYNRRPHCQPHPTRSFKGLVLLPCCVGELKPSYGLVESKLTRYERWAIQLAERIESANVQVVHDQNVLSPANIVITAWRES